MRRYLLALAAVATLALACRFSVFPKGVDKLLVGPTAVRTPDSADRGDGDSAPSPVQPLESWWVPLAVVATPLLIREVDKRWLRKETK